MISWYHAKQVKQLLENVYKVCLILSSMAQCITWKCIVFIIWQCPLNISYKLMQNAIIILWVYSSSDLVFLIVSCIHKWQCNNFCIAEITVVTFFEIVAKIEKTKNFYDFRDFTLSKVLNATHSYPDNDSNFNLKHL